MLGEVTPSAFETVEVSRAARRATPRWGCPLVEDGVHGTPCFELLEPDDLHQQALAFQRHCVCWVSNALIYATGSSVALPNRRLCIPWVHVNLCDVHIHIIPQGSTTSSTMHRRSTRTLVHAMYMHIYMHMHTQGTQNLVCDVFICGGCVVVRT